MAEDTRCPRAFRLSSVARSARPARVALVAVVVAGVVGLTPSGAHCQGAVPLSGRYAFGLVGGAFQGGCGPGVVDVWSEYGTITFAANGTFTSAGVRREVCPGLSIIVSPSASGGSYAFGTDGVLTLDFAPAFPGNAQRLFHMRPDAKVGVSAGHRATENPSLGILIALSTGLSNQTLAGSFYYARSSRTIDSNGFSAHSDLGTAVFAAAGTFTESAQRHAVAPSGSTVNTSHTGAGAYSVAADGTLMATPSAPQGSGAVSDDGEAFFWVELAGLSAELTFGVRQGSGATAAALGGGWGYGTGVAAPGANPQFRAAFLDASFDPAQGTYTLGGLGVSARSTGTLAGPLAFNGAYSVNPDGTMQLLESGGGRSVGAVGARGTLALVAGGMPGETTAGLLVRKCGWPTNYGTGTAGSGAVVPTIANSGGFPYIGNSGFGIAIDNAVGGAVVVVGIARLPTQGVPLLGGTSWIDLGTAALIVRPLSGASGVAGAGATSLPLRIPRQRRLDDKSLFLQGFVLDPGAVQGFSMTSGLSITFCR